MSSTISILKLYSVGRCNAVSHSCQSLSIFDLATSNWVAKLILKTESTSVNYCYCWNSI